MPALDTNILVRWLVQDDGAQSDQVEALFRTSIAKRRPLFVPCTVILELEWVLRSRYGYTKAAVVQGLDALLDARELEIQFESAIERALYLYRQSRADFADCLHVGLSAEAERLPFVTFDERASRLFGAELLAPLS
ncbi:MAG TPA: type II toxin-antitoxin system VapC family toxin [Nevskiales bacterium]|nr:type II toxin-antitoxin system VapC family toxin [Nevskiales bacterium]